MADIFLDIYFDRAAVHWVSSNVIWIVFCTKETFHFYIEFIQMVKFIFILIDIIVFIKLM